MFLKISPDFRKIIHKYGILGWIWQALVISPDFGELPYAKVLERTVLSICL